MKYGQMQEEMEQRRPLMRLLQVLSLASQN